MTSNSTPRCAGGADRDANDHPAIHGQVSIVDATLDGGSSVARSLAILSSSNMLYLRNVQVRGFETIAYFNRSQHALRPPGPA